MPTQARELLDDTDVMVFQTHYAAAWLASNWVLVRRRSKQLTHCRLHATGDQGR